MRLCGLKRQQINKHTPKPDRHISCTGSNRDDVIENLVPALGGSSEETSPKSQRVSCNPNDQKEPAMTKSGSAQKQLAPVALRWETVIYPGT